MSHSDDDHFDFEPVPGLPEELPEGERVLWQGLPNWKVLALTAFQVRTVVLYFLILMAWRAYDRYTQGDDLSASLVEAAALWPLAFTAIGILALMAWYAGKTTMYTITNRRIVLRIGMAYSITVNIPFKSISAVALRESMAGTCDIPVTLNEEGGLGYIHYWPHVRPWRYRNPEPMLRAVQNGKDVAAVLGQALAEFSGVSNASVEAQDSEDESTEPPKQSVVA